jgi:diketogulonate reductase-like aldo/keto reductase
MKTKSKKAVHPIGVGTWGISSTINPDHVNEKYRGVEPVHGNEEREIEAIRYSISRGQNHLDCAEMYGGFYTDEVVGRAIVGLNREDLFIADKLWKTSVPTGTTCTTVEEMLKKLGTEYLDMLYIHAPFDDAPWEEAIPQIDELIDEGIVRGFAVSNFTVEQMKRAMELSKHPLIANQMHYNVIYKDEVDEEFTSFCQENDIEIVAYRPVERQDVLHNETIQQIATSHDATPAQVAIAWLLAKGTLPIPKAVQKAHIDENLKALDLKLSHDEIETLDKL